MLKAMLESVMGLLDEANEAKTMKARETFVTCAQVVLEKCIESFDKTEFDLAEHNMLPPKVPTRHKGTLKESLPEYEIRVDNKKLVKIVDKDGNDAPLDLAIEIDGQTTTYQHAIGKPFSSGRFL